MGLKVPIRVTGFWGYDRCHKTSIDGEAKMKPTSGGQKPRVSISRQPAQSMEGHWTACPPTQDCIIFIQTLVKGSFQDDGMTIILVPGMTIILGKTWGVSVAATAVSSRRSR